MASKDMGGTRGSGSNARGLGNYGRGGTKPTAGRPAPAQAKRGIGKAGTKPKGPSQAQVKAIRASRADDARWDAQVKTAKRQNLADDVHTKLGKKSVYVRPATIKATRGVSASPPRVKPKKLITTAAGKESRAATAARYTGVAKTYVKKQLNVGPRSPRQTPTPIKRFGKGKS